MDTPSGFIPYQRIEYDVTTSLERAKLHREYMERRRSLRFFSDRQVPKQIIEDVIMTASSAPSGAHKQPWSFCAISDAGIKAEIRKAAEEEEYQNYHGRMSDEWLKDLEKFGTDWQKPFLEKAPWLLVLFKKTYDVEDDGSRSKNYYVSESVGIAAGFLITAIHMAGLVTLTHTPSPMNFLERILDRPQNEKAFLLLPVGYPEHDAIVPVLRRKSLDQVTVFY